MFLTSSENDSLSGPSYGVTDVMYLFSTLSRALAVLMAFSADALYWKSPCIPSMTAARPPKAASTHLGTWAAVARTGTSAALTITIDRAIRYRVICPVKYL